MKAPLAAVALAASALLLTACGSSTEGSSTASPSSSGSLSPALQAAAERNTAAQVEPTSVGVTEPLSKTPATGKNVTYLTCGVGVCEQIGQQLAEAVKVLGWSVKTEPMGTKPEEIVAAWDRALSANPKPDAILTSGVPVVVYQKQLAEAKAAGIPVVDWASANPPNTDGIIFDINPVEDNEKRGQVMADYIAVESNGTGKVLFINVPDFPTLKAEQVAFDAQLKTNCDGACTSEGINFAATDIGTKVPTAVVSYLQAHPDVNWIVAGWDDLALGVPEALKAAGLDQQVKLVSQSSSKVAATQIASGNVQVATIPQGVGQMAYKALDVLARHFNGDSLDADSALLPIWLQTKATIGDPNNLWIGPPGFQDQFKTLWKVS